MHGLLVLTVALGVSVDPWSSRFPEDNVLVMDSQTTITLHPQGRSSTRHRRVARPLTLVGREDFSDLRIPYCAGLQTVRVVRCAAHLPDGTQLEAAPHAINPVTPHAYGKAPDFAGFRELVVSPPGIAENVELELEYVSEDSSLLPWFEAVIPVGERHPVLRRTIRLENPAGLRLRWRVENAEGWETGGDSSAVWWTFSNLPASDVRRGGASGPPEPRVVISSCRSWTDLASWWATTLPSDSLLPRELVDSLQVELRSAVTTRDTVAALAKVVADAVEIVPAPDWRYRRWRVPTRVLHSGYADPLEAAWLTAALAGSVGRPAVSCLVGDSVSQETPPASGLLPDAWAEVPGQPSLWVASGLVRRSPRPNRPYGVLSIAQDGGLRDGAMSTQMQGRIVLALTALGDSLSCVGTIQLSEGLIPDGADRAHPERWLGSRVATAIDGCAFSWHCEYATWDSVAYRFVGGVRIGAGIRIVTSMRCWFGDAWIPDGASAFDVIPRTAVRIPADVELVMNLRILRHDSLELFIPRDGLTVGDAAGSAEVSVQDDGVSARMVRTLRLRRGWVTPALLRDVRAVLGAEARPGEAAVLIRGRCDEPSQGLDIGT